MDRVIFKINGETHVVTSKVPKNTRLIAYIRYHAMLTGTKAMCYEGGCGACIVTVRSKHPVTKEEYVFCVNSCIVSIFSCHGWSITTVEGLGNKRDGYHPIQSRLANFNGSQCGFCTPGWVMSMHRLREKSGDELTMQTVEESFAGNVCRCTGYRPILDAFKSFASDCDERILNKVQDIEDLPAGVCSSYSVARLTPKGSVGSVCSKVSEVCKCDALKKTRSEEDTEDVNLQSSDCGPKMPVKIDFVNMRWYKVNSCEQIFQIFCKEGTDCYALVAGNTMQGIYPRKELPTVMIDVTGVKELREHRFSSELVLGSGVTLNEASALFKKYSKNKLFSYLEQLGEHLQLIAHDSVRDVATIGGALALKHIHKTFPSDVFIILESVGTAVTLLETGGQQRKLSLMEFLQTGLRGKIIFGIHLPPLTCEYAVHSYKVMARNQSTHAQGNAAFKLRFNDCSKTRIEEASILFGCMYTCLIHAQQTEKLLIGMNIFDCMSLRQVFCVLSKELEPADCPPEPSPAFRKKLALGLFYKFILHVCPKESFDSRLLSAANDYKRPLSSGRQVYKTNECVFPLNQPIPKMESLVQCSGEAEFVDDIPSRHNEVKICFVTSTVARGTIESIDASAALNMDGVIAFYTAKDIPGDNCFTPIGLAFLTEKEEILADSEVKYFNQPIGIIAAETFSLARRAAKLVAVTYSSKSRPAKLVLTIDDALASPDTENRVVNDINIQAEERGESCTRIIKGTFDIYGQHHHSMESQACLCVPIEDGMNVYSATQAMDYVQAAISECLGISRNTINVFVRRIGGGFGGKLSRPSMIACACAVVSHHLNRPSRFVMSMQETFRIMGKRNPCKCVYKVGVSCKGEIQYLESTLYTDTGISHNESPAISAANCFSNGYATARWSISANSCKTDNASSTMCRASGSTEGIASIEHIMEHISVEMNLDPLCVRELNLDTEDCNLRGMVSQLVDDAEYHSRVLAIREFNQCNRWRKRGISLIPMKHLLKYRGQFPVLVSIYQADGTVSVSHSGIEMGQGINTKVAQVCAHVLGIPLCFVTIKPSNTHITPNAESTSGSISSEACCYAAMSACEILLERLYPIKRSMDNPCWKELIAQAYQCNVALSATYTYTPCDEPRPYYIYGVSIIEVEVDILTGLHQVLRIDILEDVGDSLNPELDIGQIEGATIMGLGYWTTEKLLYDQETGAILTDRTWSYKTPGAQDVPIDFRIQFRPNSRNSLGVLGSKATGELAFSMAVGVTHAIRKAITAAREEAGYGRCRWYDIDCPYTLENILMATGDNYLDHFKLE